jgi:hypothetical protein
MIAVQYITKGLNTASNPLLYSLLLYVPPMGLLPEIIVTPIGAKVQGGISERAGFREGRVSRGQGFPPVLER